jgi:asparagine synthase (glutamine-hydrolysing)
VDGVDVQDVAGGLRTDVKGICGLWRRDDGRQAPRIVENVSGANALCAGAADAGIAVAAATTFSGQGAFEGPRVVVACDTEIYNRSELVSLAGVAADAPPAALIASLYERFGLDLLPKLRGAFSFILFDRTANRLVAAVDRFGMNTLVYTAGPAAFALASRVDVVVTLAQVAPDIDPHAIARYVNYTVNLGPDTIFKGVSRLLPGTVMTVDSAGTPVVKTWWDMRYTAATRADEEALAREMHAVVAESVAAHCLPGEPLERLGAFLSGGTDSSTVTGMMKRLDRGVVKTFSIGFAEERFNELEYARITAKHFGTDHHEYLVTADDCFNATPSIIAEFDEPFGNSSSIPTYFCAKLAKENGVHALLAGDGGDELFGGNERYATDRIFSIYDDVPRFVRKGLIEPALRVSPFNGGVFARARRYVNRANLPGPERFFTFNLLVENPASKVFQDDFVHALGGAGVLDVPSRYYRNAPAHTHLDRLLYVDMKMTLGDNDLIKVTRMSELAGIRARFPFLDDKVAEFSGRVPSRLKVKGFKKRYLFKRAFRDLLAPETIVKKKQGFGIPVAFWMKRDKRMREMTRDVMSSSQTYQRGFLKRSYIDELFRLHEADETAFYGDMLWTFLALELWFRQFVDRTRQAVA